MNTLRTILPLRKDKAAPWRQKQLITIEGGSASRSIQCFANIYWVCWKLHFKKATSNIEIKETLNKLEKATKFQIRDSKTTTKDRIYNLYPTEGTHWVLCINEYYFDSFG